MGRSTNKSGMEVIMPGMNRGGAAMPGMGGGGMGGGGGGMGLNERMAGFGFSPNNPMNPNSRLSGAAGKVKTLQASLWRLQAECSAGNGRSCNQMQIVQQQLQQAQSQQQQYLGIAQAGMDRGTMGQNGRGRDGADPSDLAARTLGAMYGSGGGGGLGW